MQTIFFGCHFLLVIVLLVSCELLDASEGDASVQPIIIQHADVWQGSMRNNQLTAQLMGDVAIVHGNITLQSDEALYWRSSGQVRLNGNVVVTRCSTVIAAQHVDYCSLTKQIEAYEAVSVTEGVGRSSICDTLAYNLDTEYTVARYNVVINDVSNQLRTTGAYAEYAEGKQYGYITGNPILARTDSTGEALFSVTCDTLWVYTDSGYARLEGEVMLAQSGYKGQCDRALFFYEDEYLELYGNPLLGDTIHAVSGDSMTLFLEEYAMQRLSVRGHARHQSHRPYTEGAPKQLESELRGREMVVSFKADAIDTAHIFRNAVSIYYQYTEAGDQEGVNEVSGSDIKLIWDGKELHSAQITGGSVGNLKPVKLP